MHAEIWGESRSSNALTPAMHDAVCGAAQQEDSARPRFLPGSISCARGKPPTLPHSSPFDSVVATCYLHRGGKQRVPPVVQPHAAARVPVPAARSSRRILPAAGHYNTVCVTSTRRADPLPICALGACCACMHL